MLFIRSNSLALSPDEGERLRLLEALAARGHAPLLRAARRRTFELLASGVGGDPSSVASVASRLESLCVARRAGEPERGAYTPGELFCANDCVLFVTFSGRADEGLSAGVVYSVETAEPLAKLERFCRDVRSSLARVRRGGDAARADANAVRVASETEGGAEERESAGESAAAWGEESFDLPAWESRSASQSQGLARFIAIQPTDFAVIAKCKGGAREYLRATELMENNAVRLFLRRVQEMRREGYSARRLFAEAKAVGNVSVERLTDAGLLEREVRVSCRRSGHALLDLPTSDSLAAITLSKAKCSLCAAPVSDEVIEEAINPSWLAVALLEDGSWLSNRVYKIVRSLGVPDSEIATGPPSAHGESYMAAEVCGNSFLFVTRDGDLTPAFARRVSETAAQTEAAHLVVVVTGAVEDEGRLRLYEFVWRRARDGEDLDVTIAEGLDAARAEIERAFERAIRRELARRLFTLDAPLGFPAADFVLDRFALTRAANPALSLVPLFPELDQRAAS